MRKQDTILITNLSQYNFTHKGCTIEFIRTPDETWDIEAIITKDNLKKVYRFAPRFEATYGSYDGEPLVMNGVVEGRAAAYEVDDRILQFKEQVLKGNIELL